MEDDLNPSRLLVAAGELRPDLLALLAEPTAGMHCLLSAPGLMHAYDGHSELVRSPTARLSRQRAYAHRRALLAQFEAAIDALPRDSQWEGRVLAWIDGIASEEIAVFHAEQAPIHTRAVCSADATLISAAPLVLNPADVGHELVLELKGREHQRARKWLLDHLAQATDMSEDVLASLLGSWAGGWSTAEDVYFKILAEYFKGVVEGLDSEGDDNPMLDFLTDFQREAYVYAKTILRRFGGVFLADVVGLGKTYIALALLNHLQRRHGEHAVVVAPPAVRPAWEELAREFRVELATVSFGKLDDLDRYSDREILVIDESHNFRNVDTLRYDKVQQWLRPEGAASTRKVLLLSATPQNNTADDVKHQLGLFPDNFTRLPFRGESLDAWFREVSAGSASLSEMLQHVVVRRTRRFIQQTHPEATIRVRTAPGVYESRALQFPRRVSGAEQALRYAIDRTYAGGFYEELLRAIATMRYPLQGLGEYALPASADHPVVRRLRRSGGSVRGLFRVLLLKRLESSLVALNATLGRLMAKIESAKIAVDRGLVPVGPQSPSEPEDDDGLAGENGDQLDIAMFDAPRLRQDLDADLLQVRQLVGITARLVGRPDEKLARLEAFLARRPPAEHKTIVFTQFADTAEYLAGALGQRHGRTRFVTGSTGGLLRIAAQFAPKANRVVEPGEPIDLLVSTDALSEGVNLQDADTLINYDIHWNPVRLIQRAGRIDRIGSEHDEIHVASFLPERELEHSLGLEAVLRRRIQEFIAAFGEDSHILPGGERLDEQSVISSYTGAALEQSVGGDDDALDGLSRHAERLLRLRRERPEDFGRILALRLGRRAVGGEFDPIVATRRGWLWVFWSTIASSDGLRQVDALAAFDTLYRHSLEPAVADRPKAGTGLELLASCQAAFADLSAQFVQQRHSPRLAATELFVFDQLGAYTAECPASQRDLAERLRAWVKQGHAQVALRRYGRIWKREKLSPRAVFDETRVLYARFPPKEELLGDPELIGAVLRLGSLA